MKHFFIDTTEIERLSIIFVVLGNAFQSWRNGQKASVSHDMLQKITGTVASKIETKE